MYWSDSADSASAGGSTAGQTSHWEQQDPAPEGLFFFFQRNTWKKVTAAGARPDGGAHRKMYIPEKFN